MERESAFFMFVGSATSRGLSEILFGSWSGFLLPGWDFRFYPFLQDIRSCISSGISVVVRVEIQ